MAGAIHKRHLKSKEAEHKRVCKLTREERDREYEEDALESWDRVWFILHDTADWRLDKGTDLNTGTVHSKHYKGIGRVSKLQSYVDTSVEQLFEILVTNAEQQPEWDPSVLESKIIQPIKGSFEVHHLMTREMGGGMVARRDYVNVRCYKKQDGMIVTAGSPASHPDKPQIKKVVRGESKAAGFAFASVEGQPDRCLFRWIMSVDIGGWIPQFTIDQGLASSLLDSLQSIKKKVASVKQQS